MQVYGRLGSASTAFSLVYSLGVQCLQTTGGNSIHLDPHDGQLRPVVGVSNYQVMRANRTHPGLAEGSGWTYNHVPALAYWNDRFHLEYLSNPVDEHIAPGQTLMTTFADGRIWEKPVVVSRSHFPRARRFQAF